MKKIILMAFSCVLLIMLLIFFTAYLGSLDISDIVETDNTESSGDKPPEDFLDKPEDEIFNLAYYFYEIGLFFESEHSQEVSRCYSFYYGCNCGAMIFSNTFSVAKDCPQCGKDLGLFVRNPDYGRDSAFYRYDSDLNEFFACEQTDAANYTYSYTCDCGAQIFSNVIVVLKDCPHCDHPLIEDGFVGEPGGDSSDTPDISDSEHYAFDKATGDFVPIVEDDSIYYAYSFVCDCGLHMYANNDMFEHLFSSSFGGENYDIAIACPSGNCAYELIDTFWFNPAYDYHTYAGVRDDEAYVTTYKPIDTFDTHLYSSVYQCTEGCNVLIAAEEPFSGHCPECFASFDEYSFFGNFVNRTSTYYAYQNNRWRRGAKSAAFEWYARCTCGTFYFVNELLPHECLTCHKVVTFVDYRMNPLNASYYRGEPLEVRYFLWNGYIFDVCLKEDGMYEDTMTVCDCGSVIYGYFESDSCPHCGETIVYDPNNKNPDYDG